MQDSMMPSGQKGNKLIIILMVTGTLIMAVAGILILKQRSQTPEKKAPSPKVEEPAAMKPLVVAETTRPPLEQRTEDTASTSETKEAETKSGAKGIRKERQVAMGKLDPKEVNSFINSRFSQVKACYERRLKTNSFLEGKLDLIINISPSGKVTAVTVNSDTVKDAEMLGCVRRTIQRWSFPKPKGGRVVIAKTFNFKKKG